MRLRRSGSEQPPPVPATPGPSAPGRGGGRHRSPTGKPQGADLTPDHELESYLDAISPARNPEITDPGLRLGSARVYRLRLPPGAEEKIQWLADRYGTSPINLLQDWVLQRLHHEFGGQPGSPRR